MIKRLIKKILAPYVLDILYEDSTFIEDFGAYSLDGKHADYIDKWHYKREKLIEKNDIILSKIQYERIKDILKH